MNASLQRRGVFQIPARRRRGNHGSAPGNRAALSFHAVAKRLCDLGFSLGGLVVLSPLLLLAAALIKLVDGGDIFFRQIRIGFQGRPFWMWKFRTMVAAAEQAGPAITRDGDARVTRIGRILRKTKLDELPQLWNVLKGDMSLVGPRPEVPRYVRRYTPEQREILRYKPGITDLASLCFRDEEALLRNADSVEEFYVQQCIPRKLRLNREYARRANLLSDVWIILQTLCPYWAGVLCTYAFLLAAAFWLSWQLIHDFAPPAVSAPLFQGGLAAVVGLQLGCLTWRKQCRGLLSYFSFPELRQVGTALGVAAAGLLGLWAAGVGGPPRNVILINALLAFSLLAGFRSLLRLWRERSAGVEDESASPPKRVGIIGAGTSGARLALDLSTSRKSGRSVVAFFDDDFQKWQKHIHEVPVAGMPECLLEGWADKLDEVVVAMPGAPVERLREIDQLLRRTSLKFYQVSDPARFWGASAQPSADNLSLADPHGRPLG